VLVEWVVVVGAWRLYVPWSADRLYQRAYEFQEAHVAGLRQDHDETA
jgi:hypothetical protein